MSTTVSPATLADLLGDGWRRPGAGAQLLADGLRGLVVDGRLPVRTRLPSERALAPELGVGRGLVTRAYDHLRRDGYLASARGAGSWLALPTGSGDTGIVELGPGADAPPAHVLDLRVASLPAPEPLLSDAAARAAAALPRHAASLGYAVAGLPELREAIAARFAERGLPTRPEEVLVTSGAQQALHLVLSLLVRPGARVVVDAPAYARTLAALRSARARAVPVPLTPCGWDTAAWSAALGDGAALGVVVTDFHNPTGLAAGAGVRRALARSGVPLVVDETAVELALDVPVPPPVAAFGRAERVITIGSASKAAWGGLRIGWIRTTPRLVRELAAVRADLDMAGPVLEQLLATELLGDWDVVVESRRALLRERRAALVDALRATVPDWSFRVPAGGMSLWVRLPDLDAAALARAAAREAVLITPGPAFATGGAFAHHLRLPYTAHPDDLRRAVEVLARLAPVAGAARSAAAGRELAAAV